MYKTISVVCCFNNQNIYENSLVKSLNQQSMKIDLIGVDNTQNAFSSASKALNYGASQSKSDLIVFAHQDIEIEDNDFFKNLLEFANTYPESLIGIAGVGFDSIIYTNLVQGKDKKEGGITFTSVMEAQSLDEVLVSIPRNLFERIKFDEKICDHWHLYVVDLGLTLRNIGIKCYIIPLTLHHLSSGKLSKDYAFSLYKVIKKHRKEIKKLETTCSTTKTDWLRSTKYILGLIWDHEIKK